MKTISIKEIQHDPRIRQQYSTDKLAELADSIGRLGLLHAPVLNKGKLVCGGRRIKAIKLLPAFGQTLYYQGVAVEAGRIPFTELGESTVEEIMESELAENLMREDLTIHEEAAAKAALHALRLMQNPKQTKTDTAAELSKPGAQQTAMDIRDALLINEHSANPDVAKAKTKKEAIKIITRIKRTEHNLVLAAQFSATKTKSPHTLITGDSVDWMQSMQAETFDVIITDPPYGVDAQDFNAQDGITHEYDDTRATFERLITAIAIQGYRISKPRAHAYIFHDFANWGYVRSNMESAGWEVWPRPIIWDKGNGLLARPDSGPRYTYECILYAIKGNKTIAHVAPDVITIRTLTRQRRGAEKPALLYYDLLARSIQPGDTVLDPCCGLGPVFPAANALSIRATGIDIDPAAIGYASKRLELNLIEDEERRETE